MPTSPAAPAATAATAPPDAAVDPRHSLAHFDAIEIHKVGRRVVDPGTVVAEIVEDTPEAEYAEIAYGIYGHYAAESAGQGIDCLAECETIGLARRVADLLQTQLPSAGVAGVA